MMADLKYAVRMLIKSPAFSAVAILTLALGVGANTAIFSVVEATFWRSLPFPHADRLVRLYEATDDNGARGSTLNISDQTLHHWQEYGRHIFEDLAGATGANMTVGSVESGTPHNIQTARVTVNFFSVLGISAARGRTFTAEEDRPGGSAVAIVSHDFWRNNLASRSDVVGSTVILDGIPHVIVGVLPPAFRHPYRANIWLPLGLPPVSANSGLNHYLYVPARLRAGITIPQAEAAVRQMCRQINATDPNPNNARAAYIPPLRESFIMDLRPKIMVIVGAALCALLIAAANFAGLLLSRVVEREGEFALRAALGASRQRIIRQTLVQAMLLALLGTATGLLIATWTTPALFAMSPEGSDATGSAMREFDSAVRMDWPVFGFATGVMLLIGAGFALLPAIRASRTDLRGAVSSTSRGATLDRGTRRLLGSLVVIELAVAAALLMASITTTQYFRKLVDEPWGFATENRLAFKTVVSERLFPNLGAQQAAIDNTLTALRTLPGVREATVTAPSPMQAPRNLMSFNVEQSPPPEPRGFYLSYFRIAAPGYFKSMSHTILQGREFLDSDTAESAQVCVVTEALAKRLWPGQNPIGKRIKWGRVDGPRPWMTVVGLAADMKAIADPRDGEVIGMIARPLAQLLSMGLSQFEELTYILHSNSNVPNESEVRSALVRTDSRVAAYEVVSLGEAARESRTTERFIFVLVSLFSALGLLLAAVGLYGLLSLQVARREREFGIRTALGATAKQIIQLVARQGVQLLAVGATAGLILSWAIARILRSEWAAMPTPSVIAGIGSGMVLCLAVLLACWLPARRAARVDPIIALRSE